MNEVDKLYENAGIVPDCEHGECGLDYCPNNYGCGYAFYPPFTVEKQLELIKWMIKTNHRYFIQDIFADDFSETLAGVFNLYWQDLTEEERKQIKEILE